VPESADQRHNRELIELLNELRVALPGVQVLWAAAFAGIVALAFLVLWYGLPLRAAYVDGRR